MRAAGLVLADAIDAGRAAVAPGVSTAATSTTRWPP